MPKNLKIIFLLAWLLLIFSPPPASAQKVLPENNPLCWTLQECCQAITKGREGVVCQQNLVKTEECGSELGYCLPAGKVTAQITIGKENVFKGLSDYLPNLYRYLVSIAGIVAAVLIIKGGFDYMTSAGDATKITAAKETIGNAIMGLVLVLGSYVVLQTVNPELVNLKLPGVYLIRPVPLVSWCSDLPAIEEKKPESVTKVASKDKDFSKLKSEDYNIEAKQTECGKEYYYPGGAFKTCRGRACPRKDGQVQACLPRGKTAQCVTGFLAGEIKFEDQKIKPGVGGGQISYAGELFVRCLDVKENKPYEYKAASFASKPADLTDRDPKKPQSGFYVFEKFFKPEKFGPLQVDGRTKVCGVLDEDLGCYLSINFPFASKGYLIGAGERRITRDSLSKSDLRPCAPLVNASASSAPAVSIDLNITEPEFPGSSCLVESHLCAR